MKGVRSTGPGRLSALCGLALLLTLGSPCAFGSFSITTNGAATGCAFDGSNYLVGIQDSSTNIYAQMMSSSGAKVGTLIATGHSGEAPYVAFDGTNYLLIWAEPQVYGERISKAGTVVGSPFAISVSANIKNAQIAFGGGSYLVIYTLGADTPRSVWGRIVDPNGTMGSEFKISTGEGRDCNVAFGSTNFFVTWATEATPGEVRGRFVSTAGVPGAEIVVNASPEPSDNGTVVAFDGTNYLVMWNDQFWYPDTNGEWDVFGQLVSASGALVGGVITNTYEPGQQFVTGAAFDGSNYMAVWSSDVTNATNWVVYAQYINRNGSLIGSRMTISEGMGRQMGFVGFDNGKYLVMVDSGINMGDNNFWQVTTSYGVFITPLGVGPWAGSVDLGGGWKWLSWFGFFNDGASPWIYHNEHGWMYTPSTTPSDIWFYTSDLGWLWTSSTVYPSIYRSNTGQWLWYQKDSASPRWFFNFGTSGWESH